jgi:hypothetical protein
MRAGRIDLDQVQFGFSALVINVMESGVFQLKLHRGHEPCAITMNRRA